MKTHIQHTIQDIDNLFYYLESKDAPYNKICIMLDYLKDRRKVLQSRFTLYGNKFPQSLDKLVNDFIDQEKQLYKDASVTPAMNLDRYR